MHWLAEINPKSGQVGLIILLIVVVMSTIGISVVSRSSTDVSISKSAESANRAFDAAESGAEEALSNSEALDATNPNQVTGSVTTIPDVNVNYTVDKLKYLETVVDEGYSAQLNLGAVPAGASLDINWATETSCSGQTPASLVITIYSNPGTTPAYRKVFAGACAQNPTDNFSLAGSGTGGYFRRIVVALNATDAFARIRPVYNQSSIRVAGVGWTLPVQQFQVSSTAQSALNKETKALQVDRTLPQPPSVFDFTLFAGGTISN